MKREVLKSLELTDEVIDKIMAENGNDINNLKKQISDLESQLGEYKLTISERDKQLEELKKSTGDSEMLKQKIAELQVSNKQSSDAYEAKLKAMAVDNAVNLTLTKYGAKNPKAVKALLDLENPKMDGDIVLGLTDQIEKLVKSDSYLFHVEQKPVINGAKPADGSGNANTPAPGSYEHFKQLAEAGQL